MKKIFKLASATLLSLFCVGCDGASGDIVLNFDVEKPNFSMLAIVYNNEVDEIELEAGKANRTIPDLDAVYITVYSGVDYKTIYLERGDKATISFNGDDFPGTFKLSGDKAAAADFLNTVIPAALPDQAYAQTFEEYYAQINKRIDEIMSLLDAHELKNCGKFRKMEEGRIRYAFYSTLLMFPMAHAMMAEDPSYRPDEAYYDVIRELFVSDADYADIQQYREFMCEAAHVLDAENRGVNELYPKLLCEMRYIAEGITDAAVRERLLHHIAVPYVEHFGTEGIQDMKNIYLTYVSEPWQLADFQAACDKWDRKKSGKMATDFTAVDINGKKYSLADFAGKYLYIDIWATWCRPCQREIPHLKELEKQFEGKNITFLGLSVDQDPAAWEAQIRRGGMSGVQLYLGNESEFLKAFQVSSIPRFILLDKEGRIVNSQMSRPSSPDTARNLSELEGI